MTAPLTMRRAAAEGVIDFGIGQPSLSLLPVADLRVASDHFLAQGNPVPLQYGADHGEAPFRRTLSEFLSRHYTLPVASDELMVTAGASQALDLICTRFTKAGDTIFVEEPTYFLALLVFRDHGLNVIGIPIDENGMRMDALELALTQHHPVLLYTIPTFQNPSAVTLSAERRARLLALSQQHDFLIVADEVYHLLDFETASPPPAPLASHANTGRVLSLGSFSKICAPGLRLGWIQSAPEHLDTITASGLVQSGGGLNPFTSGVMRSLIELGLADSGLEAFRRVYRNRSEVLSNLLREHLPAVSFTQPHGGFFIWAQLPDGRDVASVKTAAEQHGVNFQAGSRFGAADSLSQFVRLSFAHYDDAQLEEGVRRLAKAVN
ncbi:MAG: PLP-dependent aminotransferase family protein [Gemmatimonadaceae bacterium]